MATYTIFEIFALSAPPADYRTCGACGESDASVNAHNREGIALCYTCAEAAEDARLAAGDEEPDCTCRRTGDFEDATGCEAHGAGVSTQRRREVEERRADIRRPSPSDLRASASQRQIVEVA